MYELFLDHEFPMDLDMFEEIIKKEFFKLSGENLGESVYIEQFSHGGMSSGLVSDCWHYAFLPLLKYRLIQSNNEYYLKNNELSKIVENPKGVIKTENDNLGKIISDCDFINHYY